MDFQSKVNKLMSAFAEESWYKHIIVGKDIKGSIAGCAKPCGTIISFNSTLAKENPDTFWKIIIHEVAHAIDIQRNGYRFSQDKFGKRKGIHHDKIFYDICRELGDPNPARTHNYKTTPSRKYKQFLYSCKTPNCTEKHILKTIRHNKLQNHKVTYYQWGTGCKVFKHTFIKQLG